jgi:hypothetical protein
MLDEPCVRIPLSEFRWIIEVGGSAYISSVDHREGIEFGLSESTDLGTLRQNERELSYLLVLLEGRLRELLTGELPAPAFSLGGAIAQQQGRA